MKVKKTRRRTGCLTCRARRVKCDEAKPECQRCSAANVECRGYQHKRLLGSNATQPAHADIIQDTVSSLRAKDDHFQTLSQSLSLRLIGLPSNPRSSQRPHAASRSILAYHQYIFRTVYIVFPPQHLWFWRDWLCEEAWESQITFDAIVALGTLHRASLLMFNADENSKIRSLDTCVIAEQFYLNVLQELRLLDDPSSLNEAQIAAALLLAYYECFAGNIQATYRCLRIAVDGLASLYNNGNRDESGLLLPLQDCTSSLSHLCKTILPIPGLYLETSFHSAARVPGPVQGTQHSRFTSTGLAKQAYRLSTTNKCVQPLMWHPLEMRGSASSLEDIGAFRQIVQKWQAEHLANLTELNVDPADLVINSSNLCRATISTLPIPPAPASSGSREACLAEAICQCYLARIEWMLSLFGDNAEDHEYLAYLHCYKAMTWISTSLSSTEPSEASAQDLPRQPCEILDSGFVPLLYLLGQMGPKVEWVDWIIERLEGVEYEGLYSGAAHAKCLRILTIFESANALGGATMSKGLPPPQRRLVPLLVPECKDQAYIAYYAKPSASASPTPWPSYHVSGRARWSDHGDDSTRALDVLSLEGEQLAGSTLVEDWLPLQTITQDWRNWADGPALDLDATLSDHLNHINHKQLVQAVHGNLWRCVSHSRNPPEITAAHR